MAEHRALALEIEPRKAIKMQAQRLAAINDPDGHRREMAIFAELQQKLAIREEVRRKFFATR